MQLATRRANTHLIVHPPGEPYWIEKTGVPQTWRSAFRSWSEQAAVAERRTIAYVGTQGGMLHAELVVE